MVDNNVIIRCGDLVMARSSSPKHDFEDYWQEFQDIERNKDSENDDEETSKTPDEGEQEVAWLQEAGYDVIVNRFKDGKELTDDEAHALTDTLTSHQAAVVKRRIDSLNSTLRKKQKQNAKTDVRDIFPTGPLQQQHSPRSPGSPVSGDHINNGFHSGPQRSSKIRDIGVVFPKKGGYSMSGRRSEAVHDTTDSDDSSINQGVEVLSMQPKGTFNIRPPHNRTYVHGFGGLSSISDEDILCEFKEVEDSSSHFKDLKLPTTSHTMKENLPNFTLVHDKLGITHIGDLSDLDMDHLRSLALIELTLLFDTNNILYCRRKNKRKIKENGLFGVPLQSLLEHDQRINPDVEVPMVFVDIINFLEKYCLSSEGLLRVPGSATRVKQLRLELEEKFYTGSFSWMDVVPNDAAALMKQYLRELPIPLLTHDYIEAFAQVENIQDKKLQLQALNLLVILLPDVHRATLKLLLSFLNKVVKHSDKNRMGLSNIAMIMAPNLFLSPSNRSKSKGIKDIEITMAAGTSNIVRMLLKYQDILWTIPSFLLQQMRHQNELEQQRKGRERSIMRFLGKKDKSDVYRKPVAQEGDFQEGVIRIQAPNLTKSCTAVQLDEFMTAGHIVDRFRHNYVAETRMKSASSRGKLHEHSSVFNDPAKVNFAQENTHLYEVGGNIGERCLDHRTRMMSLYRVNPNAEWIIRTKNK